MYMGNRVLFYRVSFCAPVFVIALAHAVWGQSRPAVPSGAVEGRPALAPAWPETPSDGDARKILALEKQIDELEAAGRFADGERAAHDAVAIRRRRQPGDHWQVALAAAREATLKRESQMSAADQAELVQASRAFGDARAARGRGDYTRAEQEAKSAYGVRARLLGQSNPATASALGELGEDYTRLGRHARAEEAFRKEAAAWRTSFGDRHPETIGAYNSIAATLNNQARYAEAEPILLRSLALKVQLLGDDQPTIAAGCNNLAHCLEQQGKLAEAEAFQRQTLALCRRILGDRDWRTGLSMHNLAYNLLRQGRLSESEDLFRQAVALFQSVRGPRHPETARATRGLADCLTAEHKYAEAETAFQETLAVLRGTLGARHPVTAEVTQSLAHCLDSQGKHAEAAPLVRQTITSLEAAFGNAHMGTVNSNRALALVLMAEGNDAEAEIAARKAAEGFELVRQKAGVTGIDRSSFSTANSPIPVFTALLARSGRTRDAWKAWESGLARGLLDDLTARRQRLSPEEQARQETLAESINRVDNRIAMLAAARALPPNQSQVLDSLRVERLDLQGRMIEFETELARKYKVAGGEVFSLERIQHALAADTALVGWIDLHMKTNNQADPRENHWACVVRKQGAPEWIRIIGSGAAGAWTKDDEDRPAKARALIATEPGQTGWRAELKALAAARFEPVEAALAKAGASPAVRRWVVLPSPALAGIPIEALLEALHPGQTQPEISYAPSATMFAWLQEERSHDAIANAANPRLLAFGDPTSAQAQPGTLARKTSSPAAAHVTLANLLDRVRGEALGPLPGARTEVEQIAPLFTHRDVYLGPDASEPTIESLRAAGKLANYEVIHLATHCLIDDQTPLNSRLILAPSPTKIQGGSDTPEPLHDDMITAGEIMSSWKLHAQLVTLSACQSGLGRADSGEGYVGFAQALFVAGGRSLLLGLWSVNDRATGLLMTRFYQNWLGKRPGLAHPMPRAQALAEAKAWLRGLTQQDVEKQLGIETRGGVVTDTRKPVSDHPFEHPYYWAGFILTGDPD